ncbi:MAG: inositol monophosphatase [Candidatus Liptonbacteria bacterium]|nr:inositol monophosphatase [Candidatus Liptonbacteria bacterium]
MKDYKRFSIELAKEAGKIIKANFALGMKKEWKSDNTPLTETDTKINQLVLDAIQKNFPGHSVLAEEGSNLLEGSEYTWVCDPVDGTIPFSHGIPNCVFALALVKNGESILGIVYDPFLDHLFLAEKNKGATLNNEKIRVSTSASFESTIIGIALRKNEKYNFFQVAEILESRKGWSLNFGSIVYMDMLVANGEFAASIFGGENAHDSAASKIIVEEAGGTFTDIFGNDQRYDQKVKGHIASNGILHQEIIDIIKTSL